MWMHYVLYRIKQDGSAAFYLGFQSKIETEDIFQAVTFNFYEDALHLQKLIPQYQIKYCGLHKFKFTLDQPID